MHPNQVNEWKNQLLDRAASVFGAEAAAAPTVDLRELHAKIGQLALKNDFLAGALDKAGLSSGAHVSPPVGVQPPSLWGTEPHIVELFGAQAADIRCERRIFNFRYRSAAHWVQVFRDSYGPTHKAFASLDAAGAQCLERDITALSTNSTWPGENSLVVPSEYLEIVTTKHSNTKLRS